MESTIRLRLLLLVLTGLCSASESPIIAADGSDCYADERQFIAVEYSDSTPLQIFLLDPFEDPTGRSMFLKDVKEKVLQRFGEPQKTDVAVEPDYHTVGDVQIRTSTLIYSGLRFVIIDRPGTPDVWLSGIEITGQQYQLKYGLGVGAIHQDILDKLQPGSYNDTPNLLTIRGDIWEKRFGKCSQHDTRVDASVELVFEFDATERVSKIKWTLQAGH